MPTGFTSNFLSFSLNLSVSADVVPTPTIVFGLTFKVIESPFVNPWVDAVLTSVTSLSIFPVTWIGLLFKKYSLLLLPPPWKNKPSVKVVNPTWVVNPIKSGPLLITNTVSILVDAFGKLNVFALDELIPTTKRESVIGNVKVSWSPVLNGWFGI